ncbi:MAG: Y-family DNA polymerase [Alphaproteobacteria bacterium]|jgi:DNA polymerase V|nr:Y-family DNA polymerase [Alphaproteobacteria bacterium]MBT7944027.1 Y-family DNA polymerase [Alphaproteobacteria bacterium]
MSSIPSPEHRLPARHSQRIALVDVNNFFASCERLFEPGLEGRPMVVLSNNDGCIIARSQEAKDLGIPMGVAVHKVRDALRCQRVRVYSSNYALYGDMSARVVSVLKRFTPYLEVYSIDESFLDLSGFADAHTYGREIMDTVFRWTGLPVSVGIGATKTLAKIANHTAKKNPGLGGCFVMPDDPDAVLGGLKAGDVWGIGRKLATRLETFGINTALDLKRADPKFIRARFSVIVERTMLELRGTSCLALEKGAPPQKGIMVSRGFGRRITDYGQIEAAIASHASRAAEKLRRQGLAANTLTVNLRTSPFDTTQERYANATSFVFPEATIDTAEMIRATGRCLKKIFKPGLAYQKAGVFLDGLENARLAQRSLFTAPGADRARTRALMRVMDDLNAACGRDTVRFAATDTGAGRHWAMKQNHKSPCYTTRWQDLKQVRS